MSYKDELASLRRQIADVEGVLRYHVRIAQYGKTEEQRQTSEDAVGPLTDQLAGLQSALATLKAS